uniref:EF-hand domain-containing protein n=2 Tax=Zea mays TaxID=4577 RepID=A0A804R742_MAIZE
MPSMEGGLGSAPSAAREVPVPVVAEGDAEEADGAEEEERDLREAFDVFDGNRDGLISAEELGTVLRSLACTGRAAADCHDMIRLVTRAHSLVESVCLSLLHP